MVDERAIKKRTAVISMFLAGILAIIFGIRGFIDLTGSAFGFVGLAVGSMLITEIGIKRITKLSKLKQIGTQQKISLAMAILVLIVSVFLLFNIEIPILTQIAGGSFLLGGVFIIIEAFTFDK